MKVIVQTAALQEALNLTASLVIARSPKPVLQCVKLEAADGILTLQATDLEAGCRYQITAVQIEEEGEALVPAARLNGIVRESGGEESITLETEKAACHIRGAGSHFKVFGYDPGEFPVVGDFEEPADLQVSSVTLAEMITKTLFATAKSHSHYAISGILLEASGKKISMVATDSHRLALAKGSLLKAASKDVKVIIPAKLMGLIQRVASEAEGTIDIKVLENQIIVRAARAVLISSLVQGNFPKYSDIIPKGCESKITVDTGEFEHRIRQAALLADEQSRGIRLSFAEEALTLSSRAPEAGEAEIKCPIKFEGEPVEIGFTPAFLIDVLRVVGVDKIELELNGANKPAIIKAGNDFTYILMPVDLG